MKLITQRPPPRFFLPLGVLLLGALEQDRYRHASHCGQQPWPRQIFDLHDAPNPSYATSQGLLPALLVV
jgi:hypothetical protein